MVKIKVTFFFNLAQNLLKRKNSKIYFKGKKHPKKVTFDDCVQFYSSSSDSENKFKDISEDLQKKNIFSNKSNFI